MSTMSQITDTTLDNGLRVVIERMAGVRSAGLTWLLPAGSATDPSDRQGLSTLWSELLFRGAGALDSRQQADAFDRVGVSRGADVSTLHLRFSATMLGDRVVEALGLIVDAVRRPRMEESSIEPARDLALQAIESLADDPTERAVIAAKERHAPTPINRSGLGTIAGLSAITRQDVMRGWETRAKPMGSILAVAGDVKPGEVIEKLDALLTGWDGAAPGIEIGGAPDRGTSFHIEDDSAQVQIVLMHDSPAEASEDCPRERVVNAVLSGGMSSRLFTEVREKRGLCYSVGQSYSTERDWGRSLAYVGTTPERAQESLDVLASELVRMNGSGSGHAPITESELGRALVGIRSQIVFSGESTGARASSLASDVHRLGRPRTLEEVAGRYESMTLGDVNGYLSRRRLGACTIVTLGPGALARPAVLGA